MSTISCQYYKIFVLFAKLVLIPVISPAYLHSSLATGSTYNPTQHTHISHLNIATLVLSVTVVTRAYSTNTVCVDVTCRIMGGPGSGYA